jgi:phosphoribosylanthranilate isomerase
MLAGGLTPENVAGRVQVIQPWGVDVASGVELAEGKKDSFKVRDFIAAAKGL